MIPLLQSGVGSTQAILLLSDLAPDNEVRQVQVCRRPCVLMLNLALKRVLEVMVSAEFPRGPLRMRVADTQQTADLGSAASTSQLACVPAFSTLATC